VSVRALVFDVFGTVVDWRSGVAREVRRLLAGRVDPLGC
jgi:2-haloacid dehalogenase